MLGLAIATPISFALAPSMINKPIDLALGVVLPLHSHVGLNYVISDYVPKAFRTAARGALMGATVITIAGLAKLNITGDGMTGAIKSLWAPKPKKTKKAAAD